MSNDKLHKELVKLPFNSQEEPEVVKLLTQEDFEGYNRNHIADCKLIQSTSGAYWVHEMFLFDPNQYEQR